MRFGRFSENRISSWVLAALAHSALMTVVFFLIRLSAGRATRVWALVLVCGLFTAVNICLYVLMARSYRAWKAKESSSKGIWIIGSIIGGGNLALTFHVLASWGVVPPEIEMLLLISTIVVTVAACVAGVFLFPKLADCFR
jgi:hypothetical protein